MSRCGRVAMTPQIRCSRISCCSGLNDGARRRKMGKPGVCRKALIALTLAGLAVTAGGCTMDDVEFNGGIFNAVGLGGNQTKSDEPKMAARTPLVLPPNAERLPAPGEAPGAAENEIAALDDPDKKLEVSKAELERQQAEYCKVNYEMAKARGDETGADLATGPLGPCRASVLTAIKKWNQGEE